MRQHRSSHSRHLALWHSMVRRLAIAVLCTAVLVSGAADYVSGQQADETTDVQETPIDMLLVLGAAGTTEYGETFDRWAQRWEQICQKADMKLAIIGKDTSRGEAFDQLNHTLGKIAKTNSSSPLWVVLIGHGTWDGKHANFNLTGPDVSAQQLDQWLDAINRPTALINCSSSSGPFINRLSGPERVVLTATKSGSEQNYSRFGDFFSTAFGSEFADVDHDDAISIREAFLKASSDVERFYKEQGRLATEHALLDDNGDRKGSDDALVSGKTSAKDNQSVDGQLANRLTIPVPGNRLRLTEEQLRLRDQLEQKLQALQQQTEMSPEQLRNDSRPILLELARLYAEAERASGSDR